MADLQRAHRGSAFSGPVPAAPGSWRPGAVRPRVGRGPSSAVRPGKHKIDSSVALRSLAISAGVVVLVLGGFQLLHLAGFGRADEPAVQASADPAASGAIAAIVPTVAPSTPNPPPAVAPAPSSPALALSKPADAPASLRVVKPAPAAAPAGPAATSARSAKPSPADFARPAFMEPAASEPADAMDDAPMPEARPALAYASEGDVTGSTTTNGRITSAINLRSAPRRGADVIGTLAAGTKVTVFSCKSWCEVAADGKRGYVYARAVGR